MLRRELNSKELQAFRMLVSIQTSPNVQYVLHLRFERVSKDGGYLTDMPVWHAFSVYFSAEKGHKYLDKQSLL